MFKRHPKLITLATNLDPNNIPDKYLTVFVGSIVSGLPDDLMRQMLEVQFSSCDYYSSCLFHQIFGNLRSWTRMSDAKGNLKSFGFAVFNDAPSVVRIVHCLGGKRPFELQSPDKRERKTLKVYL
jgi:hypothetical protein